MRYSNVDGLSLGHTYYDEVNLRQAFRRVNSTDIRLIFLYVSINSTFHMM